MMYEVYWVAGERDGEVLATFDSERDAARFAENFWGSHAEEFDPCCGGVAIVDEEGNDIEW